MEKYKKNENKLEDSKILRDNDQKILPADAAPTHGTEIVTQETIIKKNIMILPRRKAGYTQETR
jgi:hypothetical protein